MIPAVISNLDIFKVYSAMARHSAESQKVAATNIAHADEPGYKASEIESFQDYLTRTSSTSTRHACVVNISGRTRYMTATTSCAGANGCLKVFV